MSALVMHRRFRIVQRLRETAAVAQPGDRIELRLDTRHDGGTLTIVWLDVQDLLALAAELEQRWAS